MTSPMAQEMWSPEVIYHAYVLRGYLNIRWDIETMFYGEVEDEVRLYLSRATNSEYSKAKILNLINGVSCKNIREKARITFPDLFNIPETYPIGIPKRLTDKIGQDFVNFVTNLKSQKKDDKMTDATQTETNTTQTQANLDTLTVENFQEVLGRRFRMTKEQKERGISRELALEEWKRAVRAGTVTL